MALESMTCPASPLPADRPWLALAPMQDITDLAFWRLLHQYDGPDCYFTEYFRVYPNSTPNRTILRSLEENPTGKPAYAQLIGNDIPALVHTAQQLQRYPIAGIDLNLGCPAPVVYRKCAGGGLLRDLPRVDAILEALRAAVPGPLTVKTRLGFDSSHTFDSLLDVLARHPLAMVTVHGRTVADGYRAPVRYDLIAQAVARLPCPVLANGNIGSAAKALRVLQDTGVRGLMIGRGAIRNPWIFRQIRQALRGEPLFRPQGREVLAYIHALFEATWTPALCEASHVQRLKKHLNFVGLGVDPDGQFLHRMRRVHTEADLFGVCREFLDHPSPLPLEPYSLELAPTDVLAGDHQ